MLLGYGLYLIPILNAALSTFYYGDLIILQITLALHSYHPAYTQQRSLEIALSSSSYDYTFLNYSFVFTYMLSHIFTLICRRFCQ